MRMWMIVPSTLCKRHLLGQHVELHMFIGAIKKGISMKGYIENNLLEPLAIQDYHDRIVNEMIRRGMNHNTPLIVTDDILNKLPAHYLSHKINTLDAKQELYNRCYDCNNTWDAAIYTMSVALANKIDQDIIAELIMEASL